MKRSILLLAVVACSLISAGPAIGSPQSSRAIATSPGAMPGEAAAVLKQDMRKLWTDHVVWTRDYIIAAVGDQPDAGAAANRLMKNQEDIGQAIAKVYGDAAGQQLKTLLKGHISIAVDLVKAAKAGDKVAQQQADARWQQNAVQIADFLSKANPNWPRAALLDLMKMHLSTTTSEVVARLNKNWDEDVRAFDTVYDHILEMSDTHCRGHHQAAP